MNNPITKNIIGTIQIPNHESTGSFIGTADDDFGMLFRTRGDIYGHVVRSPSNW